MELVPPFQPSVLRYSAVVASSISSVEVDSFASDKYASTSLVGRASELSRTVNLRAGTRTPCCPRISSASLRSPVLLNSSSQTMRQRSVHRAPYSCTNACILICVHILMTSSPKLDKRSSDPH